MVIIASVAGKGKQYLLTILKGLLILVISMFLLQTFLYQGHSQILWQWRFISIKTEGLIYAARLSSTLLDISASFLLIFELTDLRRMMRVFETHGMSPKAAYVVISSFQILPEMNKKSKVIMDAQRSRGVETEGNLFVRAKAFLPMFLPLVLSSIISIEERALMLEARAFSSDVPRTYLTIPEDRRRDKVLRIILVTATAIVILIRVIQWI